MPRSHSGYCTGLLIRALRGSQVQFLPEAFILFTKMQTFLPYPDFERSLKTLDSRRLGKQRIEAFQILNILLKRTSKNGWKNHPAVKMWNGHTNALKIYFNKSIEIWISREYKNNMNKEVPRGKWLLQNGSTTKNFTLHIGVIFLEKIKNIILNLNGKNLQIFHIFGQFNKKDYS